MLNFGPQPHQRVVGWKKPSFFMPDVLLFLSVNIYITVLAHNFWVVIKLTRSEGSGNLAKCPDSPELSMLVYTKYGSR